jgi:hypothetical protein
LFFFLTLKSSTELGFAVFSRYWKQVEIQGLNDGGIGGKQLLLLLYNGTLLCRIFLQKGRQSQGKKENLR